MSNPINKVQVICRIRPFLSHEKPDESVVIENETTIRVQNHRDPTKDVNFMFDACYSSKISQEEVYRSKIKELVESVFHGQSATIFCYGVTGAGKTFTIQGDDVNPGIIPRALNQIFANAKRNGGNSQIKISYYEVFKENLYDLLREGDNGPGLPIRVDANRKTFIAGLKEVLINSFDEFRRMYASSVKKRHTASTRLNKNSSRSHAVLVINISFIDRKTNKTIQGKLNLIDLAGSEDNRKTDNNRERMKESTAINQSLFVLGKVIEALNSGASRIPYRDSKMTRILQDSLGGGSKSMMIVNVAPGETFLPDTHKTLNYATKTKEVINKDPVIELVPQNQRIYNTSGHYTTVSNGTQQKHDNHSVVGENNILKCKRKSDELGRNDFEPTAKRISTSNNQLSSNITRIERKVQRTNGSNDKINGFERPKLKNARINEYNKSIYQQKIGNESENQNREMEKMVVQKIQKFEEKTENMSNDIAMRLERLERKLSQDKTYASGPTLDMDILDLMSPTTKLKNSKAYLVKGKELEKSGNIVEALKRFEQAYQYAPELVQLSKHIKKLKSKLGSEKSDFENQMLNEQNKKYDQGNKSNKDLFLANNIPQKNSDGLFSPTQNIKLNNDKKRFSGHELNIKDEQKQKNLQENKQWKLLASVSKKKKKEYMKGVASSLVQSPFKKKFSFDKTDVDKQKNMNSFLVVSDIIQPGNILKRKHSGNSTTSNSLLANKLVNYKTLKSQLATPVSPPNSDVEYTPSEPASEFNSPISAKKNKKLKSSLSIPSPISPTVCHSPTNQKLLGSINKADIKVLLKLKGVGKKRAIAINEYIKEKGEISSVYDLLDAGLPKSVLSSILTSKI
ncbi:hypothetical protein BB558_002016 [Smittium angustum]|uniref:Kinesin-like protein n=1 Tax=Smittium angustum TaxID=133377 RepID=A0A2U1J9Y8_SMIAN|nr:hypothetical protein BB558_002016 [Smittium angustum]